MTDTAKLGGRFTFPGTQLTVHRLGYGAMQLAGPHAFGPPKDRAATVQVLRAALEAGVNHIDTSDYYGPHVTNKIIHEALHPYAKELVIITKLGARRDSKGAWLPAQSPQELIAGAEDNLRHLGLDVLEVVNMRIMGPMDKPADSDITAQMETLAELQRQGKIRHIGLSHATPGHLEQAQRIAPIVCVQNLYNLANRADDAFLDSLARQGIAFVPYFPLGGFSPLQSDRLNEVAASLQATPMQVALAWLLHRSPNVLLIPGTSSLAHLRENLAAADLKLSPEVLEQLDTL